MMIGSALPHVVSCSRTWSGAPWLWRWGFRWWQRLRRLLYFQMRVRPGSCGDPSGVSAVVGIVCVNAPVLVIELAERIIRPAAVVDVFSRSSSVDG